MLRDSGQMALVTDKKTGISRLAHPADWGPHEEQTGRAADLSPGLMDNLGARYRRRCHRRLSLPLIPSRLPQSPGHQDRRDRRESEHRERAEQYDDIALSPQRHHAAGEGKRQHHRDRQPQRDRHQEGLKTWVHGRLLNTGTWTDP